MYADKRAYHELEISKTLQSSVNELSVRCLTVMLEYSNSVLCTVGLILNSSACHCG